MTEPNPVPVPLPLPQPRHLPHPRPLRPRPHPDRPHRRRPAGARRPGPPHPPLRRPRPRRRRPRRRQNPRCQNSLALPQPHLPPRPGHPRHDARRHPRHHRLLPPRPTNSPSTRAPSSPSSSSPTRSTRMPPRSTRPPCSKPWKSARSPWTASATPWTPGFTRLRHPEPPRVRRHLPAPRGPARPLPDKNSRPLPVRSPTSAPSSNATTPASRRKTSNSPPSPPSPSPSSLAARARGSARVNVEPALFDYLLAIVRRTRDWPTLTLGASPRAAASLLLVAKAHAARDGREFLLPDDVKLAALPTLRHRLVLRRRSRPLEGNRHRPHYPGHLGGHAAPEVTRHHPVPHPNPNPPAGERNPAMTATRSPFATSVLLALLLLAPSLLAQKPAFTQVTIPEPDPAPRPLRCHHGRPRRQPPVLRRPLLPLWHRPTARPPASASTIDFASTAPPTSNTGPTRASSSRLPPTASITAPYVVYNARTKKYVLWYNWYPKLWDGKVGIATSDTPIGPFTIVNPSVQLSQASNQPGDVKPLRRPGPRPPTSCYTVIALGHSVIVEQLSDDYLSSTGKASSVLAKGCEAPALFRNAGTYYALSRFRPAASARAAAEPASTKPPHRSVLHTLMGNINRDASNHPIVQGQQNLRRCPAPRPPAPLSCGWPTAGARAPTHIKGHDLQYWAPLQIAADGSIQQFTNTPEWKLAIRLGSPALPSKQLYSWPQHPDPHPLTVDACTKAKLTEEESGAVVSSDNKAP